MFLAKLNSAPIEIWEHILEETISFDFDLAFQGTCSPETYLSFRSTCGHEPFRPPKTSYDVSENMRKSLRLVCRTWKAFVDSERFHERWIEFKLPAGKIEYQNPSWALPLRIGIRPPQPTRIARANDLWAADVVHLFELWKNAQTQDGRKGIRATRMELPYFYKSDFNRIFEGLCHASSGLSRLRSLAFTISVGNPWTLDALSDSFSNLTHLTLTMRFHEEETPTPLWELPKTQRHHLSGGLRLENLEVLFLRPNLSCFSLTSWALPKLHTFSTSPLPTDWETSIYPFLHRHSSTICTLDLGELIYLGFRSTMRPQKLHLPVDFWDVFGHLRLLRVYLQYTIFHGAPKSDHALQWLVGANPATDTDSFGSYAQDGEPNDAQNDPLHGSRESICIEHLEERTREAILGMIQNGVRLVNGHGGQLRLKSEAGSL